MKNKKKNRLLTSNIYAFLTLKVLLVFVMLLLTQVLFYCANTRIFHVDGFGEWMGILWGNIIFSMATIGFALLPYLAANLLPFSFRWNGTFRVLTEFFLYILPAIFLIVANVSDAAYYQFTYRRLSGEIFRYLTIGGDMGSLGPRFLIDYWYATVFGLLIIFVFVFFSRRIRLLPRNRYAKHRLNDTVGFFLGGLVVFFLFRGGFGKNIEWHDTTKYCQAKNNALVTNSGYNVLRTFNGGTLQETPYLADELTTKLFNPVFSSIDTINPSGNPWAVGAGRHIVPAVDSLGAAADVSQFNNVVVLVLESFSQEYMGCYNDGIMPSFTPFLDSLAQHSIVFNGRANGKKSIEGIPAIFTSIPTLMPFPLPMSSYADNDLYALPAILRDNGFHTAFFHGSYNGVLSFDKMCAHFGFAQYFGKNEYDAANPGNSDYDGFWGIYDEPYLQYLARQIGYLHEPFFVGEFTLSSHHPYRMPAVHANDFAEGPHPLCRMVSYSDNALRKFFDVVRHTEWYPHTLFIITADHPGQGLSREYNDYDGWYRIPMMFFLPSADTAFRSDRLMQQTDIMPTLLDYLGIGTQTVCFGTSAFRTDNGWQLAYGNGYYQLVTPQGIATLGQEHVKESNRQNTAEPTPINQLKAIVQQYNHRLINNKLTK